MELNCAVRGDLTQGTVKVHRGVSIIPVGYPWAAPAVAVAMGRQLPV